MFVVHYTYCTELCTVLLLLVRGNESTVVLSLQGLLSMEIICRSLQGLFFMENSLF